MFSTIIAVLLSPVSFLVIGVALSVLTKTRSLLGESTGLVMAGLMFLAIPCFLLLFGFALILPELAAASCLRIAILLLSFAVATFLMDRKGS